MYIHTYIYIYIHTYSYIIRKENGSTFLTEQLCLRDGSIVVSIEHVDN